EHAHSFLGTPIATASHRYGVLLFTDKLDEEEFSYQDEQLAVTLAVQLAVAYENAGRYEQIRHQVSRLEYEIGERIQAEESLDESRQRLQALFDNTQDAILLT